MGVVENMSGLRCPVAAAHFLDAAGNDVTAAALQSMAAKCPELLDFTMATEVGGDPFPPFI